jgi:hypothetical protein
LDEHVFKAALKKVTTSTMPVVESFGVNRAKILHAFRVEIAFGRKANRK